MIPVIEQQTPAAFFQPPPVVGKIAVIKIVQVQAAAAFVERIETGDFSVIDVRHGDHEFPQLFDGIGHVLPRQPIIGCGDLDLLSGEFFHSILQSGYGCRGIIF